MTPEKELAILKELVRRLGGKCQGDENTCPRKIEYDLFLPDRKAEWLLKDDDGYGDIFIGEGAWQHEDCEKLLSDISFCRGSGRRLQCPCHQKSFGEIALCLEERIFMLEAVLQKEEKE